MTHHVLKIDPEYAMQKALGNKPFEVRRNDRNFKVGDKIQYVSSHDNYRFRCKYKITYITNYEQKPGFVVFGDKPSLGK